MTPPIVLLHGWGLSAAVWAPLRAHLSPAQAIHAPDLPGHGSAAPAGDTLASWADALVATLPDKALVVGWSLGGMLALHIARHYPQKVARLVLIDTTPRFVQADDWQPALSSETLADFRCNFDADPAATQRRFVALQSLGDAARCWTGRLISWPMLPNSRSPKCALWATTGESLPSPSQQ